MRKGTVVKFINDTYYLYTNKLKRVPGKKYPQPVQKCIGPITEEGLFINAKIPFVDSGIKVYEYGFTLAVETLWNQCSVHIGKDEMDREEVLKQLVVRRSPEIYYCTCIAHYRLDHGRHQEHEWFLLLLHKGQQV